MGTWRLRHGERGGEEGRQAGSRRAREVSARGSPALPLLASMSAPPAAPPPPWPAARGASPRRLRGKLLRFEGNFHCHGHSAVVWTFGSLEVWKLGSFGEFEPPGNF
eukprot:751697-Hanusia_phi.AAC.4